MWNELIACAMQMNACGMKTLYMQSPYCNECMCNEGNEYTHIYIYILNIYIYMYMNECNEAMNACGMD